MGFLTTLFGSGDAVKSIGDTVGKLFTSDDERLERENERLKAEQSYILEVKKIESNEKLAQIDVNKEEAKSSNLFVSGWRPFVGWLCGLSLGYAGLIQPLGAFIARVVFDYQGDFPEIDTSVTMPVLLGMLGLGGFRTYEKKHGVAKH